MAENIRLEVVTPESSVVNDEAQIVMAPGELEENSAYWPATPRL
jgi:F-type H+-transporting ATPase subunit epsilon